MRGGWSPKRGPWTRRRQFKSSLTAVYGAYAFVASTGAYTYTGIAANLLKGSDLVAGVGAYTYTGIAATLRKGSDLVATTGSYAYTGRAANLTNARVLAAVRGVYTYTGVNATLTYVATSANGGHTRRRRGR